MNVAVITLFPEMFQAITHYGITSRAIEKKLINVTCINPRDFTCDRHQTVDDRPYGGGPGMVMKVEPLEKALLAARQWHKAFGLKSNKEKVVYLSPQGHTLNHSAIDGFVLEQNLTLIAGRYEGIDQRFIDAFVDEQWSVGDLVLSGGELPAMVMLDAMIRKLPNALGDSESSEQDSFENGLLDYPHYTRPEVLEYWPKEGPVSAQVPAELLSGNHKHIAAWRKEQSLKATALRRPDLLKTVALNEADKKILANCLNNSEL